MKTLTLVLAVVVAFPLALYAQSAGPTSKGNALVGGTASLARTTQKVDDVDDDDPTTTIHFSPDILYFVAPRLALGGVLSFTRASSDGATARSTTLGPEIRYFFADPAAKAQPYVGASVSRDWSKFDSPLGESDATSSSLGAAAGVIWMVSRQVGISSELFYRRSSPDDVPANAPDVTTTGIGLRFGFAAFLMR